MPIPFDRFRLLNGSKKDATDVKYQGSAEPIAVPTNQLLPEQDVGPVPEGQIVANTPNSMEYSDVRNITISTLSMDGGRHLPQWQIYHTDAPGDPMANVIVFVDLILQPDPVNQNTEHYAIARVTFYDGTMIDYPSPKFSN